MRHRRHEKKSVILFRDRNCTRYRQGLGIVFESGGVLAKRSSKCSNKTLNDYKRLWNSRVHQTLKRIKKIFMFALKKNKPLDKT